MSSVPNHHRMCRPSRFGWTHSLALVLALGAGSGCRRAAQVTRVNPGELPETYRVTCTQSFRTCRAEMKEVCGRQFHVLREWSNQKELPEVKQTGVNYTGPPSGLPDFRGAITFHCGKPVKPLRLVRKGAAAQPTPGEPQSGVAPSAASSAPVGASPPPSAVPPSAVLPSAVPPLERVCVPGVTQACLGPGACAGAQACLGDGSGFGACDCGPNADGVRPSAPSPAAAAGASPPPTPTTGATKPAPAAGPSTTSEPGALPENRE